MSTDITQRWDTFALVIGAAAGALVGLLFVAISLHAAAIAASADLRNRAAQTLSIFASLLVIAVLLSIPAQSERVLGAELLILAALLTALLVLLDRRAHEGSRISQLVKVVSPNSVTGVGTATAGALLLRGIPWGIYLLAPASGVALVGGLASAWLLLTEVEQ